MMFNKKSFHAFENINAEAIGTMSPIMRVLVNIPTWQQPKCINHNVCITEFYVEDSYKVIYYDNMSDEDCTLVHYIRVLENGILKEKLALGDILCVSDVGFYKETEENSIFPSDSEFFGYNLIEEWDNLEEVTSAFRK